MNAKRKFIEKLIIVNKPPDLVHVPCRGS